MHFLSMPVYGHTLFIINIKIVLMQEKEEILYKAVGTVIKNRREALNIGFNVFCYENEISTSTMDCIEKARRASCFHNVMKIVDCLGLSYKDFMILVEKELPEGYTLKPVD